MPSAYRLVMDKIEQSRAIVSGEVWHDVELAMRLELVADRLKELEQDLELRVRPPLRATKISYPALPDR